MASERDEVSRPYTAENFEWFKVVTEDSFPTDSFDPEGDYTNLYLIRCWGLIMDIGKRGYLQVTRKNLDNGLFDFTIERKILLPAEHGRTGSGYQVTKGEMTCKNDHLSSPVSWDFRFSIFDVDDHEYTLARVRQLGEASSDAKAVTLTTNGVRSRLSSENAMAIEWGLFDAVQRANRNADMKFTLLAEGDAKRNNQHLYCEGTETVSYKDQEFTCTKYTHLGEAICPFTYWTDSNNRLLFVTNDVNAYIYDRDAKEVTDQVWNSIKEKRDIPDRKLRADSTEKFNELNERGMALWK